MSEKSQTTRTSKNLFGKSNSKTQYFVREVKVRRMTKNGVEFLIGCRDFPLDKDVTFLLTKITCDKTTIPCDKNTQFTTEQFVLCNFVYLVPAPHEARCSTVPDDRRYVKDRASAAVAAEMCG